MNIKEIVEGMTAPQVAQVIKDNFNEVDKDKANKTDLNKSISDLASVVEANKTDLTKKIDNNKEDTDEKLSELEFNSIGAKLSFVAKGQTIGTTYTIPLGFTFLKDTRIYYKIEGDLADSNFPIYAQSTSTLIRRIRPNIFYSDIISAGTSQFILYIGENKALSTGNVVLTIVSEDATRNYDNVQILGTRKINLDFENRRLFFYSGLRLTINGVSKFLSTDIEVPFADTLDYTLRKVVMKKKAFLTDGTSLNLSSSDIRLVSYEDITMPDDYVLFMVDTMNDMAFLPSEQYLVKGVPIEPNMSRMALFVPSKDKVHITTYSYVDEENYNKGVRAKVALPSGFIQYNKSCRWIEAQDIVIIPGDLTGNFKVVYNSVQNAFRISKWGDAIGANDFYVFAFTVNRDCTLPVSTYVIDGYTPNLNLHYVSILPFAEGKININDADRQIELPKGLRISIDDTTKFLSETIVIPYEDSLSYSVRRLTLDISQLKTKELSSNMFRVIGYPTKTSLNEVILFTFSTIYPYASLPVNVFLYNNYEPITYNLDIISLNGGITELKSKFADLKKYRGVYGNPTYGNRPCNILFTSDAHNAVSNLERIIQFKNEFADYIDDMLHGGDVVQDQFVDDNPLSNIDGGEKFLNTIGNHDNWDSHGATDVAINQRVPQKYVYDKFFAPYISGWGVVQPINAAVEGYCYYYKDYAESKMRLIVLDCMNWNTHQSSWLSSVLDSAINDDYHVLICNHYAPNANLHGIRECGFESIYSDDSVFGPDNSLPNEVAELVQSKIALGLHFIAWIFGHYHQDKFGYLVDYPNQYYIAVDKTSGGGSWERDSARGYGRALDGFDIISVDTSFEILTIMRIGQNRDKFMRQKNFLTYDYKNSKIIANS